MAPWKTQQVRRLVKWGLGFEDSGEPQRALYL